VSAIELKAVAKLWGDVVALHPCDLKVDAGTFCVLLGPSGCGKSTTLRLIAGLDSVSGGTIRINDRDATSAPPVARDVAMVFQNYALFPHLSVADNVLFGLQVRKTPRDEQQTRLAEVLDLVGLTALAARKPSQLSGGQQQRVALARALVARKSICLMDEPLSNLDAKLRQEMREELRELQQRLKLTVVYVTHDQAEAMSMADQVVLLNHGRIEQAAAPREMYARPATMFAATFIGTPPMSLLPIATDGVNVNAPAGAKTLGVRPEDISLSDVQSSAVDSTTITANIVSAEYLGADSVVRCAVGDARIQVRTLGQRAWHTGTTAHLSWPVAASHFFDESGRRIST
jgi:sn-glycerol 3-phosphate transport system ATP-binding protein